ncbi:MAG: hypothetical protein EXQ52_00290 [Bryobacterales bacterium]|nr:hypothetical protein [Bryobacterales bacterium]
MVKKILGCATLVLFTTGLLSLHAQQPSFTFPGIHFPRGQDVSPTFDGWERNPDGTLSMWFGYLNRNTQEEVDVPIGPENTVDLGNSDQGQPTHFYPGRRWWVFKVVVPKEWPVDKRIVWTLTNRDRTNQAKAWLLPEWEADKLLISADGASDRFLMVLGRPIAEAIHEGDIAPVLTPIPPQTVTLPATAKLRITANDDGLPKPREGDRTADGNVRGAVEGVRIRWILYRGPGKVKFDPEVSPAVYGKPLTAETNVTFSMPGNYRIRAIASDAALFSTYDVDVKVNPGR